MVDIMVHSFSFVQSLLLNFNLWRWHTPSLCCSVGSRSIIRFPVKSSASSSSASSNVCVRIALLSICVSVARGFPKLKTKDIILVNNTIYVHCACQKENWHKCKPAWHHGKLIYKTYSPHELIKEKNSSCEIVDEMESSQILSNTKITS